MDGSPTVSSGSPVWWWLMGGCLALAVALVAMVVAVAPWNDDPAASRQAEVEARGAEVMPFDQEQTVHRFAPTPTGGTETVTVRDGAARNQVGLIRAHLGHEQMLFSTGDFSDPMAIHGHAMPGVASLAEAATGGRLTVTYASVPGGARLVYRADTRAVVDAVHAWFDAQLRDHAAHATT